MKSKTHRQPSHPVVQGSPPKPTSNETALFLKSPWFLGLLLVVATLLAYSPAWHAGFIWDDETYIINNPLLTAPDGLWLIWFSTDSPSQYFPLTYTTFRFEHALWGLNPTGYHWVNLLLHSANVLLVWRLLKRLSVPGAWLAAAIFALHPVQVESVAWITECKNVLMCLFVLLTLLAWVEFVEGRKWRCYWLALLCYAPALCSKTTACTLPAALLLIHWLKQQPINWRRLAQVVPFLAMGVGMGLLTMWWERYHVGTQGKLFSLGLMERLLIASHAVWFYLGKLLWPANLIFSYPRWAISVTNPFAYGWLAAGIVFCLAIYFSRRFAGRSVETAAAFYVATLSPVSGLIMLYTFRYTFVADHYQYVACLGPIALAAAGITIALERLGKRNRLLKPVLCGALLLGLGILTWRQCGMYSDSETLWRTTIDRNPDSFIAHNNLGYFLQENGQVDEAIAQYAKSIKINPDDWEAYYNLGNAFMQKERLDDAVIAYQQALKIEPSDAAAYYGLGNVFLMKRQLDAAIANYQRAEEYQRASANIQNDHEGIVLWSKIQNNLGEAIFQKGQISAAIFHYQKSLEINPTNVEAHVNLGKALFKVGQATEGLRHYKMAVELDPKYVAALNNLAWVMATSPNDSMRDGQTAVKLAQKANQLAGGDNPVPLGTLGTAYAEAGRFPEAIAAAQRALQLATSQNNAALIDALQKQIKLYEAGSPFRDAGMANTPSASIQP